MADNITELELLHSDLIHSVRERIKNGTQDEDGNYKHVSNEDLRVALQLLKQNNISANLAEADTAHLKSAMAAKCDFSAVRKKLENNIASA